VIVPENSATIKLSLNGQPVEERVPATTSLWELLHRHLGRHDVRYGCGEGVCGACTVLLEGEPVCSCLLLAVQADGSQVTTASGLDGPGGGDPAKVRLLREHLLAREAFQCGFCAGGMLVSAFDCIRSDGGKTLEEIRENISGNLCRCTGYELIEEGISAAAAGAAPPVRRKGHEDLQEKLSGSIQYPTTFHIKDALIGRVLWSEWPSARILEIDTREAKAIPGVEEILTYEDIPGSNFAPATFVDDQPILATDRVRSMADAVALVAARSDNIARQAIRRIRVVYEPLSPVTNVTDALKPDSVRLGKKGNVIAQVTETKGDVDAAFKEADEVVTGVYGCNINDHSAMELVGGVGWLKDQELFLSVPTQTPHTVRNGIARALRIAGEKIHIVSPSIGGSFGKYLVPSIDIYLALLVDATQKPVRLVLDREEVLARTTKRHAFTGQYRLGLRKDGSFLALDADIITDAGPYVSLTPVVVAIFAAEATGAYEIPNLRIAARGVLTNNLIPSPMRGFGSQQVNFGIECVIEKAARRLGIDSAELRRRNYKSHEAHHRGVRLAEGESWLARTMDRVVARLGARPQPTSGWLSGRGVGSIQAKYGYPYGMVDRFTARLSVDSTGRFLVESDIADAGTGVIADIPRLVAKHLSLDDIPLYKQNQAAVDDPTGILFSRGVSPSPTKRQAYKLIEGIQTKGAASLQGALAGMRAARVARLLRLIARPANISGDLIGSIKSSLFPYGLDSFNPRISGSRAMFMVGRAALDAADHLKDLALDLAARKLDVPKSELVIEGAAIRHRSNSSLKTTWGELANSKGGVLAAMGESHLPAGSLLDPGTGNQTGPVDSVIGSHGVDLLVNPETGAVRIMRYVACHDVGRVLNRQAVLGQLIGGIAMGIGQALYEGIVLDEGKVTTAGLHDYLVPSSLDLPDNIEIEMLESGSGLGPEGAKGVGEAGAVGAPIAIANALYDALGVQPSVIPAMPDEIVNLYEQGLLVNSPTNLSQL